MTTTAVTASSSSAARVRRPPPGLTLLPLGLVLFSTALQGVAWLGWLPLAPGEAGHVLRAIIEMLLVGLLVWNGWRIWRWCTPQSPARGEAAHMGDPLIQRVALLCLVSLAICAGGDWVNRNFSLNFHAYDSVVEHSYLADSVWYFLPGYGLYIVAAWLATRKRVGVRLKRATLALAAAGGALSFASMVPDGVSDYVRTLTGLYAILITGMVPVALWIVLAFGRSGVWVAIGAVLATVADALIGQFWLYGDGYFPGIAYLNWVVYFVSQALIQRLPLVMQQYPATDSADGPAASRNSPLQPQSGDRE